MRVQLDIDNMKMAAETQKAHDLRDVDECYGEMLIKKRRRKNASAGRIGKKKDAQSGVLK